MSDENDEKAADDGPVEQPESLADTLLHQGASDPTPKRRWAYPLWGVVLVSTFVLYHSVILLVHNLPSKGLSAGVHKWFNNSHDVTVLGKPAKLSLDMRTYMQAVGNTQSWAMFAPNPHRSNIFMKVMVKDKDGEVWDMAHDIYGRRRYPYLFYDRMGKINRRIVDQKGYRRHYAAWVCREWERTHEGEPADEIQFVKMWTRIPPPQKVIAKAKGNPFRMGYDPMELKLYQREEDAIRCKTTRHAQLPNYLRERYGLPLLEDEKKVFRPVHQRTWHDKKETAERAAKARDVIGDRVGARLRPKKGEK
ncbi:MAG: hypothetical protein AAGA54_07250 [Myxococcota bacterium]